MCSTQNQENLVKVEIDKNKLDEFSEGLLNNLKYDNLIIAGGSISKLYLNLKTNNILYKNSDIDIYLYGTKVDKIKTLKYLLKFFKYTVLIPYNNVFTLYFRGKTRQVQIICGNFNNVNDIITNFDYSHLEIFYDGKDFIASKNCFENLQNETTKFNPSANTNEFRLYKTLLLGLNITNCNEEQENNFQNILENEIYKKKIHDIYYPKLNDNLYKIKNDLEEIYLEKYNINSYKFRNIVNNLELIEFIDWDSNFLTTIKNSYLEASEYYILKDLIFKIRNYIRINDVESLRKIGFQINKFKYAEKFYPYFIEEAFESSNIGIIFQIYYIFKDKFRELKKNKLKIILDNICDNICDNIGLYGYKEIKCMEDLQRLNKNNKFYEIILNKILKKKHFKQKYYICYNFYSKYNNYLNILRNGNRELFDEYNKIEPFQDTYTNIALINNHFKNLLESGNLEFIKYFYTNYFIKYGKHNTIVNGIIPFIKTYEVFDFCCKYILLFKKEIVKINHFVILLKTRDIGIIKYLIDNIHNCYFDIKDVFGYICYSGNVELVKNIIENYDINISKFSEGAFRYACKSNNLELVKLLYEKKNNISFEKYNYNCLKEICINGNQEIFDFVIGKILEKKGQTYLDFIKTQKLDFENLAGYKRNDFLKGHNIEKDYLGFNYNSLILCALFSNNISFIINLLQKEDLNVNYFIKLYFYKEYNIICKIQKRWKNICYDVNTKIGKKIFDNNYMLLFEEN